MRSKALGLLTALFVAIALAGCEGIFSTESTTPAEATAQAPATAAASQTAAAPAVEFNELEYRLGPGDQIRIIVFGNEELSGEFEVGAQGDIAFPLIGQVAAGGKTLRQVEEEITRRLQPDYLKDPRVNAEVLNYRPFFILGEVRNPGSYPYQSGMRVVNAIALAGGYTYRAKEGQVLITRAGDPSKQKVTADQSATVLPGDIIEVPERFF